MIVKWEKLSLIFIYRPGPSAYAANFPYCVLVNLSPTIFALTITTIKKVNKMSSWFIVVHFFY